MYESGDVVGVNSNSVSITGAIVVLMFLSSLQRFAYRQRACTSSLCARGALSNDDEAEEIEEEREERDEISDTIDSGDDADDIEFASEDLRGNVQLIGDEV